ncbi:MAG: TIGR03086 family metal-binding protein [Acidimicrobiales bacterium]
MSDISDRYRRLSGAFVDKVSQVSPERWSAASPCEGWTARDVVVHVVDAHGIFFKLVDRPFERTVSIEDDTEGALRQVMTQTQAELDDPARAGAMFDGFFGRMSFEDAIDRFICFDLVVHGWDLARAVGLDETITPAEVVKLGVTAEAFGDALHTPGVCGPSVDAAPEADDQTKLLALLGRRA